MIKKIKSIIPNKIKQTIKLILNDSLSSIKYWLNHPVNKSFNKKNVNNIIFVCKGNICRSAFAEARLIKLMHNNRITIKSCGLEVNQGNQPPVEAIQAARKYNCDLSMHIANKIRVSDILCADLIFPMEYDQYKQLIKLFPQKSNSIFLLRKFIHGPTSLSCNINDPFGRGIDSFEKTFEIIDNKLRALSSTLS